MAEPQPIETPYRYGRQVVGAKPIRGAKPEEAYMVRMVICGIGYLLSQCAVVDESWNDELELTPAVIEAIKEQCPDEVEW